MRRWYIVTTYSGYENSVMDDLIRRRETLNMQDQICQVLVPEETIEVTDKKGKKKTKVNKLYPGYVFVEMNVEGQMDDQLWFNVRNTPKVTGFLGSSGSGTKPIPVPVAEMDDILRRLGLATKPKIDISVGDKVELTGSFKDTVTEVVAVNTEKETVTVLVDLFGRSTQMEFPINEVKKIN
ncbi:MAG: transcription termination/antitermination protein NusG [Acholeplasmatales bacterium]|nr:transcription termination/antitermination protein NusG [Acholeplasmatales bacterium]